MNYLYSIISAGFCSGTKAHHFKVEEKVFVLPEGLFSMPFKRKMKVYSCECGCRRVGGSLFSSVVYK
jgi:hypothetical protein